MFQKGFVRWGIIAAMLAVLVRLFSSPDWIERYYSRGVFPLFRMFWDTLLTSWLPLPVVYLLLLVLLARGLRAFIRWRRLRGGQRWLSLLAGTLGLAGWVVFTFLVLWGFNYGRIPVEDRLGLPLIPIDTAALAMVVRQEADTLARLRAAIPRADTTALTARHFTPDMEPQLRTALEQVLTSYNYPKVGHVRGRLLYPRGVLLRISTAGVYLPWTGEGHIDAGLIHLQRPYTMAHEMAHGYGFGDEGTCSFWAYLTAFTVHDPALQYAIRLGYWRSLTAAWARTNREAYLQFRTTLPPGISADLEAIRTNLDAYPDILPAVRDATYDAYLKAQGINEGLANYGKVVLMVEAWRKKRNTQQ
jgi:hypothetical protein